MDVAVVVLCAFALLILILCFAFLLRLYPNTRASFYEVTENGDFKLDSNAQKYLSSLTPIKSGNNIIGLKFEAVEGVTYLDVHIALKTSSSKTHVKSYKLSFRKSNVVTVEFKDSFDGVQLFINQVNNGPYKEQIVQYLPKKAFTAFLVFSNFALFIVIIMMGLLFQKFSSTTKNGAILYWVLLIFIGLSILGGLDYLLYCKYEKYLNGGLVNDRN